MERPLGWALFENEGRLTHAVDLAQVKIICIQASTGGTDIRITDGSNSYWINVKSDPMTCIEAIARARKEVPTPINPVQPLPPADLRAR